MLSEKFTVEETNLICIFNTSSRNTVIAEILEAMPRFEEEELTDIAVNALKKLDEMSDLEFAALELYPEYEEMEV